MSFEDPFKDPGNIIMDSANQLMQFGFHMYEGMTRVRELISTHGLKTLEEYTHKTTAELEAIKPGVTTAYNALVIKLRDHHLTQPEFEGIMKEVYKVTH